MEYVSVLENWGLPKCCLQLIFNRSYLLCSYILGTFITFIVFRINCSTVWNLYLPIFPQIQKRNVALGEKKSVFIKTKQNKKMYNPFHVSITEQISEYLVQGSNNKELIQNTDYLKLLIHKDTEYFFLTTKSGIPFLRRVDLGGMTWTN